MVNKSKRREKSNTDSEIVANDITIVKNNTCGNCEKCKYQEKCIYRDNLTK